MSTENKREKNKIYGITQMAIMAALVCVLSPMSIPIGPVPISFANLALYLTVYILGWKKASGSFICFLVLGAVGLPVFSGFSGGIGKLLGPTGGYIIGFLPMIIVSGIFIEKFKCPIFHFFGLILGTAVCYAFGTAWFCYEAGVTLSKAMSACVIPFIPGDLVKIIFSMFLGPAVRRGLSKAGLVDDF